MIAIAEKDLYTDIRNIGLFLAGFGLVVYLIGTIQIGLYLIVFGGIDLAIYYISLTDINKKNGKKK